jgi:hypothetical protein
LFREPVTTTAKCTTGRIMGLTNTLCLIY